MEQMSDSDVNQNAEQSLTISKDARMWAMFCHISAFAVFVIPFVGQILGPLLIWMLKKEEYPFVDDQGKEALNFQISITIYAVISSILIFVIIGIPILIVLGLFALIMVIVAAISSYDGKAYRYPLTIRVIK